MGPPQPSQAAREVRSGAAIRKLSQREAIAAMPVTALSKIAKHQLNRRLVRKAAAVVCRQRAGSTVLSGRHSGSDTTIPDFSSRQLPLGSDP